MLAPGQMVPSQPPHPGYGQPPASEMFYSDGAYHGYAPVPQVEQHAVCTRQPAHLPWPASSTCMQMPAGAPPEVGQPKSGPLIEEQLPPPPPHAGTPSLHFM